MGKLLMCVVILNGKITSRTKINDLRWHLLSNKYNGQELVMKPFVSTLIPIQYAAWLSDSFEVVTDKKFAYLHL